MLKRPTIRDIARIANVSHVTVSRALRSNPRISQGTQDRIKKIAAEVGYRPDPMLSALMAYRNLTRPHGFQGTIAWLNTWSNPSNLRVFFPDYWEGALKQTDALGYRLEEIRLADFGTKEQGQKAVSRILRARNIQGVLIPPHDNFHFSLDLDWRHLSVIVFGFTWVSPQFDVVANAQMRSCALAIRKLKEKGYQRIGYVVTRAFHERTGHNFTGAYLADQQSIPEADRIPPVYVDYNQEQTKELADWYRKYHPDVIIIEGEQETRPILDKSINTKRCSLVSLCVPLDSDLAGIRQNNTQIGRVAVDQLVARMQRGEWGIPKIPFFCLIEGEWVDGPSLRERKTPPTRKPAVVMETDNFPG